jgi:hypothetical protein
MVQVFFLPSCKRSKIGSVYSHLFVQDFLTAPEIDIKTAKIGKKFLRSNQLRKLAKTATGFNYVKK